MADPDPLGAAPPTGQPDPSATDPAATPEPSDPTPSAAPAEEPDADDIDATAQRHDVRVINKFYGHVHASQASFGVSGGLRVGHASVGSIPTPDVDHALRYFTRPAGHDQAARTVGDKRLVLLVGDSGVGRRTGALALLRELTGAGSRIVGLSPAMTLTQLNEYEFGRGRGYVLLDWLGDRRDAAVLAFDVERLGERLRRAGAYLVLTVQQRALNGADLGQSAVRWSPPTSLAVLDAYLAAGNSLDDAAGDRVRSRVAELRLPAEVVRLLDRLPHGVDAALAEAEQTERKRVAAWFAATSSWEELLRVAALAFAHELPERTFEEVHARLREIDAGELTVVTPQPPQPEAVETLQGRRSLYRDGGLVARRYSDDPGVDGGWEERRIVFAADAMREHVLGELYECGYRLWRPLRAWIDELAATGDLEVRLQLAYAMTLLARHRDAAPQVRDTVVRWAAGRAAERFTAMSVLSFMAAEDQLAPAALRLVLDWTDGRGQNRAVTAAMALGGPLGIRYHTEAEPWLWHLSTRGKPIRTVAVRSFGLLFCTAAIEPDAATRLLKRLVVRLDRTLGHRPEPRRAGYAIETVLEVLSVEHLEHAEPVVAYLMRLRPAATSPVGVLWAESLRSLPHRAAAIEALRLTLQALSRHEDAEHAVRALGDVLRGQLTEAECGRLRRELAWALRTPGDPAQHRPVIAVLLTALAAGAPRPALR
ncbi:hypothetical protein [Micromonospora rosaria]|uniref:hypothetical protein n=1 Tax=Micromonospora rosaria TaxID=47874 RepID=UPI000A898066|nr:hypothetical protein [Micromonospora rosaria]